MFFKSSILKSVAEERSSKERIENNSVIDDSKSIFKLTLLESSIHIKNAKNKKSLDELRDYFLDNRMYIPKDSANLQIKTPNDLVSSGYIILHINDLRNKMSRVGLTHKDFEVIPNYEGLRDRVKELFKLEILKEREEKKIKDLEKSKESREKIVPTSIHNFKGDIEKLSKQMIVIKNTKNIQELIIYLMDNSDVIIPTRNSNLQQFNSRRLIYIIHGLKMKSNIQDSDFNILPSYGGFREKVKELLS